jgi:hypothetical protein
MSDAVPCRMVACRDAPGSASWTFYLINDSDQLFDEAALESVEYEWGNVSNVEAAHVRLELLLPGAHAAIWHDDGDGAELRMELLVTVWTAGQPARLRFMFPILYKKTNLPVVDGLDQPGWEARPVPV